MHFNQNGESAPAVVCNILEMLRYICYKNMHLFIVVFPICDFTLSNIVHVSHWTIILVPYVVNVNRF